MKHVLAYTVLIVVIAALVGFNVHTVRKVSRRSPPAEPPELNEAPIAVYGLVEPEGREVALSPRDSGVVRDLRIQEGDLVRAGQIVCVLDDAVARAELEAAGLRVSSGRKAAELSRDAFERNAALVRDKVVPEADFTQSRLRMEFDEQQVALYERQLALAEAQLADLRIAAPRDGIVYLCDIREGEYFAAGDANRIVIGAAALQVRCDVEAVWIGRFRAGQAYGVFNADTGEPVGTAAYRGASRYLRAKRIRSEDPTEKLAARFQEVTLDFKPQRADTPIYLPVVVRPSGS